MWRDAGLWIAGVALAALAVFLRQRLTGALTAATKAAFDRITGRGPLTTSVSAAPISFLKGHISMLEYVIPLPVEDIPAPPGALDPIEQREAWAAALGGVDARETTVLITVTGRTATPVILRELRVNVLERLRPLKGTHVTYGPLGDAAFVRWITVDLDVSPPRITQTTDQRYLLEGDSEERPIMFPYRVSETEAETFFVAAATHANYCVWEAEILWSCGTQSGSTVINDDGRPFRTTASSGAATYMSNDGETFHPVPESA